jgi:GNAT superfamily N-acetyltransferase
MPIEPDQISLRPASPDDVNFVVEVTEAAMRAYAEQTFGKWDSDVPRARFDPANSSIIQLNGEDVGCMDVVYYEDHLQLNVLYLLPSVHNQGIGTVVLGRLIAEADAARKAIRLRVLRVNPAQQFYARNGFVVTDENDEKFFMERRYGDE